MKIIRHYVLIHSQINRNPKSFNKLITIADLYGPYILGVLLLILKIYMLALPIFAKNQF
jgi:hypothetical protein